MQIDINAVLKEISPVAKEIFTSYVTKGKVDNATWLTQILASNKYTAPETAVLAKGIISTIGRFSANMNSINKTCAQGKTKEQWFKNFIEKNVNMPPQEKGEHLAQAAAALSQNEVEKPAQWNKYTSAPVINDIAKQAESVGANGAAIKSAENVKPNEKTLPEDFTEEPIGSPIDEGLKMAATVALKIAHSTGKLPFLPKQIPIAVIANIACLGVETARNVGRVATGKISSMQAVENIGRASIVAVADIISSGAPAAILAAYPAAIPLIPVVEGMLMMTSSEDIQQKIYAGIEKVMPVAKKIASAVAENANVAKNTVKIATQNFA